MHTQITSFQQKIQDDKKIYEEQQENSFEKKSTQTIQLNQKTFSIYFHEFM